jgi:hypothetical protein
MYIEFAEPFKRTASRPGRFIHGKDSEVAIG